MKDRNTTAQDAWDEFVAVFLDAVRPYVSPVLDWLERRLERLSRWMTGERFDD